MKQERTRVRIQLSACFFSFTNRSFNIFSSYPKGFYYSENTGTDTIQLASGWKLLVFKDSKRP